MRYHWLCVLLIVCLSATVSAQDDSADQRPIVPDVRGMTVAQAAAELHVAQLQLTLPVTLADAESGQFNRVVSQSPASGERADSGTSVSVSVTRPANLLLVYDRRNFGDDDFHLVNLSDEPINLYGIEIQAVDTSRMLSTRVWGNLLLPRQCVQAWDFDVNAPYQPPECDAVQGTGGVLRDVAVNRRVWQETARLRIVQDGILRAECLIADERCALWVSPDELAEDVTPYIDMTYDRDTLLVINRSEAQWMPLFQTRIDDARMLSDGRLWDTVTVPDLTLLAPGQCVRFQLDGASLGGESVLPDCTIVAERSLPTTDVFWRAPFTVTSIRDGLVRAECPPATANGSICYLPR